jgi:hypothetical protein
MLRIRGTKIAGIGAAANCVVAQLPRLCEEFPEIAGCHPGTINVRLEQPLLVVVPDHRTRPIQWYDAHSEGEVFDIVRIQFEAPIGSFAMSAWLYVAHGSPHRRTPYIHEVLAPKLEIPDGAQCEMIIERNVVTLPYEQWPAILIV